jgi:hypothetical protein
MMTKEEKDRAFRTLLELEKFCNWKDKTIHRWTKPIWDDDQRVWLRRCELCGAIEVWRVNDTVFYSEKTLFIFHDRHEFTKSKTKAVETLQKALKNTVT